MDNPSNSKRKYKTEKANVYKKIKNPNQIRIEPQKSGYTTFNNTRKIDPKFMKTQFMTKTGHKSRQKCGNF